MTYSTTDIELAAANNCTPEEYLQAFSDYADHYKDVHGIKARWAYGWTLAEYRQGHEQLTQEWHAQKATHRQYRIERKLATLRAKAQQKATQEAKQRLVASVLAARTSGFPVAVLASL